MHKTVEITYSNCNEKILTCENVVAKYEILYGKHEFKVLVLNTECKCGELK